MLRFLNVAAAGLAGVVALSAGTASAQFFGGGAGNCGCTAAAPVAMMSAPTVTACSVCQPVVQTVCAPPVQPVMQTVYRDVPVTEFQPVRQTVKRQSFETQMVSQAVTEYRPITETRVVEVPSVSYQNVTECQSVVRNMGFWRTQYQPVAKMAPCAYDSRPGFAGWMNRTGFEIASAFQPNYRTSREYVPQTMVQAVPVTRQVAVQSTRQVAYNVTRMEPYQTTRQVAVSVPKWEDAEVTVMKPVTVVKSMAVGTQISYVPVGSSAATATAIRPQSDPLNTVRGPTPRRTADGDKLDQADPTRINNLRSSFEAQPQPRIQLVPTSLPPTNSDEAIRPRHTAALEVEAAWPFEADYVNLGDAQPLRFPRRDDGETAGKRFVAAKPPFISPTAARVNQWVARTPTSSQPDTASSAISVADTVRP
jgi:hypothetical protein